MQCSGKSITGFYVSAFNFIFKYFSIKIWSIYDIRICAFFNFIFSLIYKIIRWFRISDSGGLYPVPPSQRIFPAQSLLLIKNVDERDLGRWVSFFFFKQNLKYN